MKIQNEYKSSNTKKGFVMAVSHIISALVVKIAHSRRDRVALQGC